ncbi:MAG: CHAP domain-containing protein [Patescibacteria group bacterium]|nr:CHAP domain-containing protein [Patescibacteria group bacterium]
MKSQLFKNSTSDPKIILACEKAARFLQNKENQNQNWHGLNYSQVEILLRKELEELQSIGILPSEADLEKLTPEEILKFLEQSQAPGEVPTAAVPTSELQNLIVELDELEQQKAEIKEKVLSQAHKFLEDESHYQRTIRKIRTELEKRLGLDPLGQKREQIIDRLDENLEIDPELSEAIQRLESTSLGQNSETREQVEKEVQRVISQAVARDETLNKEQKEYIEGLSSSLPEIEKLSNLSDRKVFLEEVIPKPISQTQEAANLLANQAFFLEQLPWRNHKQIAQVTIILSAKRLEKIGHFSPSEIKQMDASLEEILGKEIPLPKTGEKQPLANLYLLPANENGQTFQDKSFSLLQRKGLNPETVDLLGKNLSDFQKSLNFAQKTTTEDVSLTIDSLRLNSPHSPLLATLERERSLQVLTPQRNIAPWEKFRSFVWGKQKFLLTSEGQVLRVGRPSLTGRIANFFYRIFAPTVLGPPLQRIIVNSAQRELTGNLLTVLIPAQGRQTTGFLSSFAKSLLENLQGSRILISIGNGTAGFITGQNGLGQRMGRGLQNVISALSSADTVKGPMKILGIFAFAIFIIFFISQGTVAEVFFNSQGISSNLISSKGLPSLNCDNPPRHLAEEVICRLVKSCGIGQVLSGNINDVDLCLDQPPPLLGLQAVKNAFHNSAVECQECAGYLQCVGFTVGIQNAIGQPLTKSVASAKDYIVPPYPQGYAFIEGSLKPQVGDLVIWPGTSAGPDGHIGIVIGVKTANPKDDSGKISVAQANGYDGSINVLDYPFGNGADHPGGYLRWSK